jgi:hypothetical protein
MVSHIDRMRLSFALLVAFALAVLPFGMTSMMQAQHSAMAANPQAGHLMHAPHGVATAMHHDETCNAGQRDCGAPFAHCPAAQMTLPATDAPSHPVMTAIAIRLPRLADLEGRAGDPSAPPPRG